MTIPKKMYSVYDRAGWVGIVSAHTPRAAWWKAIWKFRNAWKFFPLRVSRDHHEAKKKRR